MNRISLHASDKLKGLIEDTVRVIYGIGIYGSKLRIEVYTQKIDVNVEFIEKFYLYNKCSKLNQPTNKLIESINQPMHA